MKFYSKKVFNLLFIFVFTLLFVSCVTTDDVEYKNGYYIVNIDYGFNQVRKASAEVIESGEVTVDTDGEGYLLKSNKLDKKKNANRAVLKGINESDSKDTILLIITEVSENITKISIKYGDHGNSIRASTFVKNLKKRITSDS